MLLTFLSFFSITSTSISSSSASSSSSFYGHRSNIENRVTNSARIVLLIIKLAEIFMD